MAGHICGGVRRRRRTTDLLYAALFLLCFCGGPFSLSLAGRSPASRKEANVNKHLKRLNKSPVKSIHSPDGDIIDCVPISKQPAFDHPFLKDHKIQMRPEYHPEGLFSLEKESSDGSEERTAKVTQLWHMNGHCPEDTVPIRRTKKEDVLRASSAKRFGKKKPKSYPLPMGTDLGGGSTSGHQHAIAFVEGDKFYGAKATINVWEPKIEEPNEFSLSQIWVLGGTFGEDLNSIEAGWQVSPGLYGDNNTRLFTYWTSDAYQATGCYNLLCSGFIQTNNNIAMGASISPVSAIRNSQYDISILIWKDPNLGNWWMQYGNNQVLGYWPSFLFSNLADSANMVQWGGEVVNTQPNGQHTSTQMGSGQFPDKGFGQAGYFRNIQVVDSSNKLKSPKHLGTYTEQSNCYDVRMDSNDGWGHFFYFGGPGRNEYCP